MAPGLRISRPLLLQSRGRLDRQHYDLRPTNALARDRSPPRMAKMLLLAAASLAAASAAPPPVNQFDLVVYDATSGGVAAAVAAARAGSKVGILRGGCCAPLQRFVGVPMGTFRKERGYQQQPNFVSVETTSCSGDCTSVAVGGAVVLLQSLSLQQAAPCRVAHIL